VSVTWPDIPPTPQHWEMFYIRYPKICGMVFLQGRGRGAANFSGRVNQAGSGVFFVKRGDSFLQA
jgi:hypothetical protein